MPSSLAPITGIYEPFGDEVIKLKDTRIRIKFEDTSTGSYPGNDWQIVVNDSAISGLNRFSIEDLTSGDTPFTIEAGARADALYIDGDGLVGLGTSTPGNDPHIAGREVPTIRLEAGAVGDPGHRIWDIAGNADFFYIRTDDGDPVPFSIDQGAPANSLRIADDGNVGLGTWLPDRELHIKSGTSPTVRLEQDDSAGSEQQIWDIAADDGHFSVLNESAGATPFLIDSDAPTYSLYVSEWGRLGIGTGSPTRLLDVGGGNHQSAYTRINAYSAGVAGVELAVGNREWSLQAEDLGDGDPSVSICQDCTPNTGDRHLTIDSAGHTFIGATSSDTNAPISRLNSIHTEAGALKFAALLENRENTDDTTYTAIGFSTNQKTIPKSAILHQRTGPAGVGRLQFAVNAEPTNTIAVSQADVRMTIDASGNVGIGGGALGPWSGSLHLFDGSAPPPGEPIHVADGVVLYSAEIAGSSFLNIRDEAGNTRTITPHNFVGYTPDANDPYPWTYYSRNDYLGEEVSVDMSGAIRALEQLTGRTFIHRRQFPRADWATAKRAEAEAAREQAVLRKMGETVEVAPEDAVEPVELTKQVEGTLSETVYRFDRQTGKAVATQRKMMVEQPTGEVAYRIKPGVRLDPRTGKYFRNKTRAEAEAEVGPAIPQPMPQWIAERLKAIPFKR